LHAIVNGLPGPNYGTLRALMLHLNRVAEASSKNHMTARNLAIVFAPTLIAKENPKFEEAAWQARFVQTILSNTLQIFDKPMIELR
jgi:hypothetical protein